MKLITPRNGALVAALALALAAGCGGSSDPATSAAGVPAGTAAATSAAPAPVKAPAMPIVEGDKTFSACALLSTVEIEKSIGEDITGHRSEANNYCIWDTQRYSIDVVLRSVPSPIMSDFTSNPLPTSCPEDPNSVSGRTSDQVGAFCQRDDVYFEIIVSKDVGDADFGPKELATPAALIRLVLDRTS